MIDLRPASGAELDRIALSLGVMRRRWFWIFKERDAKLRARLLEVVQRWNR